MASMICLPEASTASCVFAAVYPEALNWQLCFDFDKKPFDPNSAGGNSLGAGPPRAEGSRSVSP